jgi:hypothetical protein
MNRCVLSVSRSLVAAFFVTTCWTTASPAEPRPDTDDQRVPFTKLLCLSTLGTCVTTVAGVTTPALPVSFIVPAATASGDAVKELVVEFVSGDCAGTARTTTVFLEGISGGSGGLRVADTGDNFTSNKIPMSVAQFNDVPNVNGVQAFAQQTQLTYAPGTTISVTFDFAKGGVMACFVTLNGHFVTSRPAPRDM